MVTDSAVMCSVTYRTSFCDLEIKGYSDLLNEKNVECSNQNETPEWNSSGSGISVNVLRDVC